ncbi:cyclin-D4-1-like [Zingiber officinale]|uniref:cyclin-D4-1-like n=1 Tax=Zingiber officinale TaxID=94328 RepID=UPI001C4B5C94|nr:cyclin-D4-1-like [Zingiber officinale]
MSPSFHYAPSILFCAEDNGSILRFDDEEEESGRSLSWAPEPKSCVFERDCFMDFPLQSDECLSLLVEREMEYLPREDYGERLRSGALNLAVRGEIIDWMWKAHAYYQFGALSAYLCVNYLDRFLNAYELPQGKSWMTQLLSVACLSLAAKMEETEVPLILDLQVGGEAKFVFEAKTIQRMELLVLSTLKWRMQTVTPFSFIDFFLHKFSGGNAPSMLSLSHSAELVLATIRGVDFLEFRPSVIAAAIALTVLGDTQVVNFESTLSCCSLVAKEEVSKCLEAIENKVLMRRQPGKGNVSPSVSSVPQSPFGVLDAAACLSYKSDDATVVSQSTSHGAPSPASKRRKTSR